MTITKEFRDLSSEELRSRMEEFKKELLKLNAQVVTGANVNSPGKLKQTKKNIARIMTILKEKEVQSK
ncbi:MAG: 50S ribosomal protein L29 [Nanoarchaeota archaeon]|nr:50S ribosomal protein L29 [Nanoarchaeota archaeon]MBU1632770.1 50S ribosomal protein L29 [Nanoarchaeota archaeon]MBU1876390.1 50S ribosomal protein L29 [Nanoarchaeota archaeon]